MNHEEPFLQAMVDDLAVAFVFADWLEERGDPRGELLRLTYFLTRSVDQPNRPALEERLRALLAAGVEPVGHFRTNSIGMKLAWIPPGTFLMGSPLEEFYRSGPEDLEDPAYYYIEQQHRVTLTKGFWMAVHPVTQAQWQAVMGSNPSRFNGDNLPVESVSWDDGVAFCEALGKQDGKAHRLPTEAEWEYACRAGTSTPFHFGATISTDQANYDGNDTYGNGRKGLYRQQTTPVGSFPASAWGLFDMHGNVSEGCQDWHKPYETEEITDPLNRMSFGNHGRVVRGGSWRVSPWRCRSACRHESVAPGVGHIDLGCRVVLCLD